MFTPLSCKIFEPQINKTIPTRGINQAKEVPALPDPTLNA